MTDDLRELFVDVTGEEATTEPQAEEPSHDPIDGETATVEAVAERARDDGLGDAVEGAETGGTDASAD